MADLTHEPIPFGSYTPQTTKQSTTSSPPPENSAANQLPLDPQQQPSQTTAPSAQSVPSLAASLAALPCLPNIPLAPPPMAVTMPFMQPSVPDSADQLTAINTMAQTPIKLTPGNYQMWYSQWRSVLVGYNLIHYVLYVATPEQKANGFWLRQDQLLRSALIASLSIEVVPFILSDEYSFQVWKTLHNMYANLTKTHVMTLKDSLSRIKKGNLSISMYLQKVKQLVTTLNASGATYFMDDVTLHVINGLPSEYQSIVSSIRTRRDTLSFDELHQILERKKKK